MKKVFAIVLTVMMLCCMMIPVHASSAGEIGTDKAEYLEGEMIKMYYEFPAKDPDRQIWVYKNSVAEGNRVWVISATGVSNEGYHPLFYPANTLATPGDYIMKVVKKNGDAYSHDITATFKVKANPGLNRTPSISLDKTTYNLGDIIKIHYDGITDALPYDKILQITFYDSMDVPVSSDAIYLWDTRTYIGISGTLEVDTSELDFWADSYYAILESNDESMNLSNTRVDFTIADPDLNTQAPATDAPATQAPATDAPATQAPATDVPAPDAPTDDSAIATPVVDGTETPENGGQRGNNTVLFLVIGISAALFVALVVVVILLIKKKK